MKTRYILTCIAALLAFCACNDTKEEVEINGTQLVLTAYQEGSAGSKTAVEDGGKQVFWEPGDEIKVFSGSRSGKFTSSAESLEAVTTFTGHLEGTGPDVEDIWAVYPYSDEASFDGECITTVIPSVQVASPGTFAQGANVAIAHSATTNLQFYNVGGGIRFSLTEEGVNKVIFEGLGGEVISGTVKVGFEEGLPKVKEVSGGSMFITLTPPEGESVTAGELYYLTAIPGELNNGFKLRLYKDDDTYAKVASEKAYVIKRSLFGSAEGIDNSAEYESVLKSFPETEAEWEQSFELSESITNAIQNSISIIDNVDQMDVQDIAELVLQIDGVVDVETSDDQTAIIIQQEDQSFLNYILKTEVDDDSPIDLSQMSPKSGKNNLRALSYRGDSVLPGKKKAILLAPYYNQGVWISDDIVKEHLAYAGYSLDFYPDDKANLDKFHPKNLKDYGLVLIRSHGIAKAKTNSGELTTAIATGENTKFLKNLLHHKSIARCIITSPGEQKPALRYCITTPWLQACADDSGSRLDNSLVYAGACQTLVDTDLRDCFFNLGAAAYCGFTETTVTAVANLALFRILNVMSQGAGLSYASDYFLSLSDDGAKMDSHLTRDGIAYQPEYSHLLYQCNFRNGINDFFLFDSSPYDLKSSVDGPTVSLSWNVFSHPTDNMGPEYLYYWFDETTQTLIPCDIPAMSTLYDFEIYVDGHLVTETTYGQCHWELTDVAPKEDYTWQVVAKVLDGNLVCNTFTSPEGQFTVVGDSPKLPVPEAVDLGLSVKWASFNLGSSKPEEYGDYFAWGETEPYYEEGYAQSDSPVWQSGKSQGYWWPSYKWCNGTNMSFTKYCSQSSAWDSTEPMDYKIVLDLEDDAARVNLGSSWRIPTYEEWIELRDNSTSVWTTENGIAGRRITSTKPGYTDKFIFLPAAGQYSQAKLCDAQNLGYYWSATRYSSGYSGSVRSMTFNSGVVSYGGGLRCYGFSIRPVTD